MKKDTSNLFESLKKVLEPVVRKRGLIHIDLVARWPEIVGENIGRICYPEKLSWPRDKRAEGATLTLRAAGSDAFLLKQQTPVLINRLNAFFGFKAVKDIKIAKNVFRNQCVAKKLEKGRSDDEKVCTYIEGIEADGLSHSLRALGRQIIRKD